MLIDDGSNGSKENFHFDLAVSRETRLKGQESGLAGMIYNGGGTPQDLEGRKHQTACIFSRA